jgi:nitroreductase
MPDRALHPAALIRPGEATFLVATAARAPSVHNTQPWRFVVGERSIELHADPGRKLRVDPLGREMLISCGAALFGLRLAVRSLGYEPVVVLEPDPARLRLLARVTLAPGLPPTPMESQLLQAMPHRHTHRGQFEADPLPPGLIPALQHDAFAEGARLAPVDRPAEYEQLAEILAKVAPRQDAGSDARADLRRWTRSTAGIARDGVPAQAFAAEPGEAHGRLRQRDFDLGRGFGQLTDDGPPPAITLALLTPGDRRADWLIAGQALHRVLLHAASKWVFAGIFTQPLEAAAIRELIRDRLELPGNVQMLLQLGIARTAQATPRRSPADVTEASDLGSG